ncbi:MAG: hypothetical protein COV76_01865 [Candidatus Omnitrophica bacterium CG11_big_fil_rev_8_21_14_0_20_64_10]|nr:MAG: hypothetical protein COV76_01865 [Candidatus Omnitrophica bacterium CG11_big_fil_rev_8_21_14_0_20_64_10]
MAAARPTSRRFTSSWSWPVQAVSLTTSAVFLLLQIPAPAIAEPVQPLSSLEQEGDNLSLEQMQASRGAAAGLLAQMTALQQALQQNSPAPADPEAAAARFRADEPRFLSIGDDRAFSPEGESFGIILSVKLNDTDRRHSLVVKQDGSGWEYDFGFHQSEKAFFINLEGIGAVFAKSAGPITAGRWYTVEAWVDRAAGTLNIRVDEGPVDSMAVAGSVSRASAPVQVGWNGVNGGHLDGAISGLTFWKGTPDQAVTPDLGASEGAGPPDPQPQPDPEPTPQPTPHPQPAPTGAGVVGEAISFSGQSADAVTLPSDERFSAGPAGFGISLWVNLNETESRQGLVVKQDANGWEYELAYHQSEHTFFLNVNGLDALFAAAHRNQIRAGEWNLLTAWYDAAAGTLNIQVNDDPVESKQVSGAPVIAPAVSLQIGSNGAGGAYLNGRLDEVRFWEGSPSSSSEIAHAGFENGEVRFDFPQRPADTTPPQIELASDSVASDETYLLQLTADGAPLSEMFWRLGRGTHRFVAEAEDDAGNRSRAAVTVRREGELPEPVDPPAIPAGDRVTQTLTDGSTAIYVNGALVEVRRTDGSRLIAPTLDETGEVRSGWVEFSDGTLNYLEEGELRWSRTPLGAVSWFFEDGLLEAVRSIAGTVTAYAYRLDANGQVDRVMLSTAEETLLLDPDGSVIARTDAAGQPLEGTVPPPQDRRAGEVGLSPDSLTLIEQAGRVTGLAVERDDLVREYDTAGELTGLTFTDGTRLNFADGTLVSVTLPDGRVIEEGTFDDQNRLLSGRMTLADGTVIRYAEGAPAELMLTDGSAYALEQVSDGWRAQLVGGPDPSGSGSGPLTELIYDTDWRLRAALRSDGAELSYDANGRLMMLIDASGLTTSYAYNEAGQLTSALSASPDPAVEPIRTEYAYGKIRRVLRGETLLYEHSYEFDPDGAEVTVIHDLSQSVTKRYRAGLLISQTDPEGAVTTYRYTNDPAGDADPMHRSDAAQQLLPDGTQVTYDPRNQWQPMEAALPDGSRLQFTGGALSGWVLPDGTALNRISDSAFPENLLPQGDFADWPAGSPVPAGWWDQIGTGATLTPSEEPTPTGERAVVLTAGPGAAWLTSPRTQHPDFVEHPERYLNKTVTLGAWVKSDQPGAIRLAIVGNVGPTQVFSTSHSGSGEWEFLWVTKRIIYSESQMMLGVEVAPQASASIGRLALFEGERPIPWESPDGAVISSPNNVISSEARNLFGGLSAEELLLIEQHPVLQALQLPDSYRSLTRMVDQGFLQLGSDPPVPTRTAGSDPVLAGSEVTYQGKSRGAFSYRYEGELTEVTDGAGVTRAYDSAGRMVGITQPDGTRYEIRHADDSGEEVIVQTLSRRILEDGTTLSYSAGRLSEILLPDGRVITDFTVDANGLPIRATLRSPGGTEEVVQNGALVEVTRADQVKLLYREGMLAELALPETVVSSTAISGVTLDAEGKLSDGEILLSSGDRLILSGGRFVSARLADGAEVRSVELENDQVTGATLSVAGSSATLSDARDVEVRLPSGQEYLYRYAADGSAPETMTFRDDFSDGNLLGWQTVGSWSVEGGRLKGVERNAGNWVQGYARTGLNWADYTASTRYTLDEINPSGGNTQLIFRYQDENNHYFMQVIRRTSDPHQGWSLLFGGRVGGQYFEKQWFALPGFRDGVPQSHDLQVAVAGSTFRFFVDGRFVGESSDGRLTRGSVGFGLDNSVVRFDQIEVAFPGEDLRDPATRSVDFALAGLRQVTAAVSATLENLGTLPGQFNPDEVEPTSVRILGESTNPAVQAAVEAIRSVTADPSLTVMTERDGDGKLLTTTSADGTTTAYNDAGKPGIRYDRQGAEQLRYQYDAAGYLTGVTFVGARAHLEAQITALQTEVQRRSTFALERLAQQRGVVLGDLKVQIEVQRELLANQADALSGQLSALDGTPVHGKAARQQKSQALDQIRGGINQVRLAQGELERQYAELLSDLDGQVASAHAQIEQESAAALAQIATQRQQFIQNLLRQELTPLLYEQFRSGIGRDPNAEEIAQMIASFTRAEGPDPSVSGSGPSEDLVVQIDLPAIRRAITELPDYDARVAEVAAIRSGVRDWLTDYLAAGSDPLQMLASLGLTSEEVVTLTAADAERILGWLDSRSLHFGHSAFLALKELLAAHGGPDPGALGSGPSGVFVPDTVSLAVQTILIDILVGVLNPKVSETAELELSLYALNKVAGLYNLTTTPSEVSFKDFRSMLSDGPAIAHINGNHYILVTHIAEDGTVTYREPNKGPAGETLTMTQQEFERVWEGVVLTPRAPPRSWQALTDAETQAITGSFFPLLIPLFTAILSAMTAAVGAVVTAIGAVISSLGTLITGVFNAIGGAFTGLFNGLSAIFSGNFLSGLATIGKGLLSGVTGVLQAGANFLGFGSLSQLGTLSGLQTALGSFVWNTALPTALNFGVSKGLEALGVDPAIAGLVGAFASGGIAGTFNSGITAGGPFGDFLAGGFTSAAIAGTQLGLAAVGLDQTLASLAGIGVGTITSSLTSGVNIYDPATGALKDHLTGLNALGYTLSTQLAPTLAGELAFYGIQRLGESVGLDPRLSQLAGMPLKAGIGNIANPGHTSKSVMDAMGDGLLHGATSLGIDLLGDEVGLDPFTQALSANVISGAISGAFKYQGNVFKGVSESLKKSVLNFSTLGTGYDPNAPYNPVQQATYLAKINDFSNIVRERGITTALETYASSIFQRDAIESIWKLGGIADFLLGNAKAVTLEDGRLTTEVTFKQDSKLYLDATTDAVLARSYFDPTRGLVKEISSPNPNDKGFGLDEQGRFGLVNGKVLVNTPNGLIEEYTVFGGNIVLIEGRDAITGKTRYFVSPGEGKSTVRVSPDGRFIEGQVVDLSEDYKFSLLDGDLTREIVIRPTYTYSQGQIADARVEATGFEQLTEKQLQAVAEALEAEVPATHVPTAEELANARKDADGFRSVVEQELTKQLGTEDAGAVMQKFWPMIQNLLVGTPEAFAAVQQGLQEEQPESLSATPAQTTTALGRAFDRGLDYLRGKGDAFADDGHWVVGGTLHTLAVVADFLGDPVRIGSGINQAKQAAAEGHYGAAALYVLQDGLRAISFIPAARVASTSVGRALQTGISHADDVAKAAPAATNLGRIGQAFKNLFRVSTKVYDEGAGSLKLQGRYGLWEFENAAGKGAGKLIKYAPAEEITVVRVVKAVDDKGEAINPLFFGDSAGRVNSEGTRRLYATLLDGSVDETRAIQAAIKEGTQHLKPGDAYRVFTFKIRPGEVVDIGGMSLTDDLAAKAFRESLGDTVNKSFANLGGVRYTSAKDAAVTNLMIKNPNQITSAAEELKDLAGIVQ